MFPQSFLIIATPPIKLSWHVIFRHDEYEKNLFVSPRRCYHILSLTAQSLQIHTFSLGPSQIHHRGSNQVHPKVTLHDTFTGLLSPCWC